MKPLALAFKNYEINPFTDRGSGELMIIHQCVNCGEVSPNRIAGDDNVYQILFILDDSFNTDTFLMAKIRNLRINIITPEKREDVLIVLFGINYSKYLQNS